jgi:probable rRNA maturation factor
MRSVGLTISDERLQLTEASLEGCLEAIEGCPDIRIPDGSLEVAFVDSESCSQLHKSFFNDPGVTDVMTFPGSPEDEHAGDIAICPAVATEACRDSGLPFHEELSLYLVHACLHLSGFDDHGEAEIKKMRQAENTVMRQLHEKGALLAAKWRG